MGLFSALGKVLGTVGKVASLAPGVGGIAGKVLSGAGAVLAAKKTEPTKAMLANRTQANFWTMRGKAAPQLVGGMMPAPMMQASPVLPGGAVASPTGPKPKTAAPPKTFGGSGGGSRTGKRRSSGSSKKATRRSGAGAKRGGKVRWKGRWWTPKQLKFFRKK